MSTSREALEVELAALIERDKPKARLDAVRAEIAKLPEPESDGAPVEIETTSVESPENTSRPHGRPRKK